MRITLDASAAIEIVLNRSKAKKFHDILIETELVVVPDLYVAEVTNVIWKYHKFSNLPLVTCEEALTSSLDLIDDVIPSVQLAVEAFSTSCIINHTVYDSFYLIVARRFNTTLLTLDNKLIDCCKNLGIKFETV